jgi:hypothetical protein
MSSGDPSNSTYRSREREKIIETKPPPTVKPTVRNESKK